MRDEVEEKERGKTSNDVFEYMGGGQKVPIDVVRARLHPSVTELEVEAFYHCSRLKEIMLNEGLQKIGNYAFSKCVSLEKVTIPSTVTEIGRGAFIRGVSLREVVLTEGLRKIQSDAFHGCSSMVTIKLPSTLDEIGVNAFMFCSNLKSVVLHEGVKNIGRDALYGCESMERFKFTSISLRLENIINTGHYPGLEESADQINTLSRVLQYRDNELFSDPYEIMVGNWPRIKQRLDSIVELITYYEMKEAMTSIELALWKAKIDQAWESYDVISKERDEYRIAIPGPVENMILQYTYPTLLDDNDSVSDNEVESISHHSSEISYDSYDEDDVSSSRSSSDSSYDISYLVQRR